MVRPRLVLSAFVLLLLMICPGCHVLVRLGEPVGQEPAPLTDGEGRPQDGPPPSSGPETQPPLPGLDDGENRPPIPGLENGGESRASPKENTRHIMLAFSFLLAINLCGLTVVPGVSSRGNQACVGGTLTTQQV